MIGLFDSGVGGLSVVRALLQMAPESSFVYVGDTARVPYGNKSPDLVRAYAIQGVRTLIAEGATSIVIACNTVSATAISALQATFPETRFYEVITPAVALALALPSARVVGVIGTRTTIATEVYQRTIATRAAEMNRQIRVVTAACPLFVPLAEEGWVKRAETRRIARTYLQPIRQAQADALILGCTHYPMLIDAIRASVQRRVTLIDSASAVVRAVQTAEPSLFAPTQRPLQRFLFTDASPRTQEVAQAWLRRPIQITSVNIAET